MLEANVNSIFGFVNEDQKSNTNSRLNFTIKQRNAALVAAVCGSRLATIVIATNKISLSPGWTRHHGVPGLHSGRE
jgi:hypothetical protein